MSDSPIYPLCTTPIAPPRREEGAFEFVTFKDLRWRAGSTLTYGFLTDGDYSAAQADVVRAAWRTWRETGMNLAVVELADPAQATIRIRFDFSGPSDSQVGLWNEDIPSPQPTMRFGWDLAKDEYGRATALHEIGHALGLQHEHQNPSSPVVWNEAALIDHCAHFKHPWTEDMVRAFIIDRFDSAAIDAPHTSAWDPLSIMQYSFAVEGDYHPISAPEPWASQGIPVNYVLSPQDVAWARLAYP